MKINIIELFSGIGGFSKGFIDAGYEIENHYFSEIDKHAIANYKYNFKNAEYIGSVKHVRHIIRTINANRGGVLALTFGSPCQDFSLAGKGKGLDGSKSSLIKYAIFLIKWLRPDIFIWENVKGAFSTNNGADYWAIIQAFANLRGYRHEQQLLNTSWFLPQNRERIYLIGHLAGRSEPGVFPIGETSRIHEGVEIPGKPIVKCLTARGQSDMHSGLQLINDNKIMEEDFILRWQNKKDGIVKDTICPTLRASGGTDIRKQPKIVRALTETRTEEAKKIRKQNLKKGKDYSARRDKELTIRNDENANTVTAAQGPEQFTYVNGDIRRLTEIECERLQGFPDNWTKYGDYDGVIKEIPKTQRYKLCGNAVTKDVVEAIAKRLKLVGNGNSRTI